MSDHSDEYPPKPPKLSLHSQLQKTKSWITLVVGSVFSVILIGFQAAQLLNTLATKQQVENTRDYLIKENLKVQQDLDYERKNAEQLRKEFREVRAALVEHLEKHAGRLAAEREPDRRKAARAAEIARRKFRAALAEGKTLEEALASTYDPFLF